MAAVFDRILLIVILSFLVIAVGKSDPNVAGTGATFQSYNAIPKTLPNGTGVLDTNCPQGGGLASYRATSNFVSVEVQVPINGGSPANTVTYQTTQDIQGAVSAAGSTQWQNNVLGQMTDRNALPTAAFVGTGSAHWPNTMACYQVVVTGSNTNPVTGTVGMSNTPVNAFSQNYPAQSGWNNSSISNIAPGATGQLYGSTGTRQGQLFQNVTTALNTNNLLPNNLPIIWLTPGSTALTGSGAFAFRFGDPIFVLGLPGVASNQAWQYASDSNNNVNVNGTSYNF